MEIWLKNPLTMKKLFTLFVFIQLSFFSMAQSLDSIPTIRKNVVKFLPVNLPFQTVSFEYERMISAKNSFSLGIGIPNKKSVKGKYSIIDNIDHLKSAELSTFHVRAAFRHYTGKSGLPKGFYLEPYLKYQKISGQIDVEGSENGYSFFESHNADFYTKNFGIQLGTQFLIAKRVSLDIYFLGIEVGQLSGKSNSIFDRVGEANHFKSNLENLFDDGNEILYIGNILTTIGKKIEITQSPDEKTVSTKASNILYPWFRGGFSIGIAF